MSDIKTQIENIVKVESKRPIELEYQEDGAVVVRDSRRILDHFDSLQEACEYYGPDSDFNVPVKMRATTRRISSCEDQTSS